MCAIGIRTGRNPGAEREVPLRVQFASARDRRARLRRGADRRAVGPDGGALSVQRPAQRRRPLRRRPLRHPRDRHQRPGERKQAGEGRSRRRTEPVAALVAVPVEEGVLAFGMDWQHRRGIRYRTDKAGQEGPSRPSTR